MTDSVSSNDLHEQRVNEAVAEYLEALRSGTAPDRDAFLARHPGIEGELVSFLNDQESFARLAAPLGPTPLPGKGLEAPLGAKADPREAPTLAPGETAPATEPGGRCGDYELLEEIARGGMGVVYRARQVRLNRLVALKMILAGSLASPADVQRFRTEAEAAAGLDHPHIVPIYEVGEHDGRPFFSMRLIEGGPLTRQRERFQRDPREAARLVVTVARAVHYAHQRGILHRDLKPANILLDAEGQPHVTDFGLAKRVTEGAPGPGPTQTGAIVGTPSYMAPEQASGDRRLSTAADVYSLGAVLYELLTGRPPFCAATPLETLLQVIDCEPVRPGALRPGLDVELETVSLKCLDKEPARRYASAEALAEDLERFLVGEPVHARPCTTWERGRKWARRRPAVALLSGLSGLGALALLVLAGFLWHNAELRAQGVQDLEVARNEAASAWGEATVQAQRADQKRQEFQQLEQQVEQARRQTRASQETARHTVYAADLLLAHAAWQTDNVPREQALLDRHVPAPGQEDLRSFEWYYLQRLAHRERLNVNAYVPEAASARPNALFDIPILVAVSADGRTAATASLTRPIKLWNLNDGKETARLQGPGESAVALSFAAGDKGLILTTVRKSAAGQPGLNSQASRAAATGNLKPSLQPLLDLLAVYSLGKDRGTAPRAERFDPARLEVPFSVMFCGRDAYSAMVSGIIHLRGHHLSPQCFARSPDRKLLAVGGLATPVLLAAGGGATRVPLQTREGAVLLWDLTANQPKALLKGQVSLVTAVAFSPDGKTLAASSIDRTIKLWDVASQKEQATLQGLDARTVTLAFAPGGTWLASGSVDGVIKLWDPHTGQARETLRGHVDAISSLAFRPDGKTLVSASLDGTVKLWDVPPPPEPRVLPGLSIGLRALGLLPDGKRLAAIDGSGRITVWDLATGKELTRHADRTRLVWEAALAPDGQTAAIISSVDDVVWLYDVTTGQLRRTLKGSGKPRGLAFSPDGRLLATGGNDKVVKLWDVRSGQEVGTFGGHKESVLSVTFTRDGKSLAAGCGQWRRRDLPVPVEVKVWDLATGQARATFAIAAGSVRALAFRPDGKYLASASGDTIRVWDLASGKEVATMHDYAQDVVALAFSPDGKRLASGSTPDLGRGGGVKLWDPAIGQEVLALGGPADSAAVLAFSADGRYLVSGSDEISTMLTNRPLAEVKVWNATPPDGGVGQR
jgi:WD40 repeat protein/serine/threonine protein kinase